jgi:alkylhydroperoxidase/carboxymuconolactone decarboxylase family protein YurZ
MKRNKGGRPPKPADSKKGANLNVRISEKLRDLLLQEAERIDGSISDAVTALLWKALTAEQDIEKRIRGRFGDPTTQSLLSNVADGIATIQMRLGNQNDWLDHPFVFDQSRKMIDTVLDLRRPRGRADQLPENMKRWPAALKQDAKNVGETTGLRLALHIDAAGDKALARGLRTDELEALRKQAEIAHQKLEKSGEAGRGKVAALQARTRTINAMVSLISQGCVAGTKVSMAKVFSGITGAQFAEQRSVIVQRIRSATQGKLKVPEPNFDGGLAALLDHAASWETSWEVITDKQHRDMQRRAMQPHPDETEDEANIQQKETTK